MTYPWRRTAGALTSQLWARQIPILDQGAVGSCTGNEQVGALGTDPLYAALPFAHPTLDEALALKIYSGAEIVDGNGPYPPNDNGSSGPSAAQVAKNLGWISGYLHAFSLADVLDALETGPVGIGANWYDSYDRPDSSGHVSISPRASIRGGHEFLCRGKDTAAKLVICDNSWGTGWGNAGSFTFSWDDLERLLAEQGDATVSLPLTTPVPPPVPPQPPVPDTDPDDDALALAIGGWARSGSRIYKKQRAAARTWMRAKGFPA